MAVLSDYQPRVVDAEIDDLLAGLAAISLEGPKGVGKTSTAQARGGTVHRLDDPAVSEIAHANPAHLLAGRRPVVIDEWQRYPSSWDLVRRSVDDDNTPGRLILTGSATPVARTHSGAGRIVPIRMRPLTLVERGVGKPSVSMGALLSGQAQNIGGSSDVTLDDYLREILTGGFPGMRLATDRAQRAALDGYVDRVIDTDLPDLGTAIRRPETLRRWLRAYAAATSTAASYDRIRDAATAGEGDKPAKTTTIPYRDALERIWILDPLMAWAPALNRMNRLVGAPKHHLVDPALAARLVGIDAAALLRGEGPSAIHRDGTFLGALFESLCTLCVRVFAQAAESRVLHFRTKGGEREIDMVVVRSDERVVCVEVKLSQTVEDRDVRHLHWMRAQLGDDYIDGVVLNTGPNAYRRSDGVAVVPLALLGP
jgi:predicted AAA+ superfamily ATPase